MKRLLLGLVVLAAAAAALYLVPSDHYLFLPDPARPVDPLVRVPGEEPEVDQSGVLMVDILLRKASLLERLFPGVQNGSSLVPGDVVNPHGLTESERHRQGVAQMTASRQVAVAVALRSLGYRVRTEARIVEVENGAPADGTLEIGDVVLTARGAKVTSPAGLAEIMRGARPGDRVRLTVRRAGAVKELVVGTRPADDDPSRAIMGIRLDLELDAPVSVRIDAGSVVGPSAGLAFALDIVDELGRDIDGGRRIAATGALDLDGTVAGIGGVKQKTIGAREAGADVFVVPAENAAEARRYAEGLEVVPVRTFREALTDLKTAALSDQ